MELEFASISSWRRFKVSNVGCAGNIATGLRTGYGNDEAVIFMIDD
jgi:hypothetical protein